MEVIYFEEEVVEVDGCPRDSYTPPDPGCPSYGICERYVDN